MSMPQTNASIRLFVAIDPPESARHALAGLPGLLRGVTWTPPHQYHLTLRFIGETSTATLESIQQALARVRVEPFILPIAGVGTFPPNRPPRVIWAGVGSGHPRLHQLRQRVDDALLSAGLADLDVRTFHPHFTLGRCGAAASAHAVGAFVRRHRDFEGPSIRVTAMALYRSDPVPGGVTHTCLTRFALTGA